MFVARTGCYLRAAGLAILIYCRATSAEQLHAAGSYDPRTLSVSTASWSGREPRQQTSVPRAPLARLIHNPDTTGGLPPFALTDQTGTIQRYVEPVPGIDLAPFVGCVVVVRHDTGRILLASQLELPPLIPLPHQEIFVPKNPESPRLGVTKNFMRQPSVQHIEFVDDDDGTVQLLPEAKKTTDQIRLEPFEVPGRVPRGHLVPNGDSFPFSDSQAVSSEGHATLDGPAGSDCYPAEVYGAELQPGYDAYHEIVDDPTIMEALTGDVQTPRAYGEIQINFLRAHVMEESVGKLSEKYEFSPRFIFALSGFTPLDGRVRYWIYRRDTPVLDGTGLLRLEFDVLDIESTRQLAFRRSELLLSAGLRLGNLELIDPEGDEASADLVGMTLAADGRTWLHSFDGTRIDWAYGGRLSVLGADWGGDSDHDFLNRRIRDDNIVAHELYTGLECSRCYRAVDLRAGLGFEMQNWHSDVLDRVQFGSLGFLGPSLWLAAAF